MAVRDPLEPADAADQVTGAEQAGLAAAAGRLGHQFATPSLLAEALTHRSAAAARGGLRGAGSNERLEFIGDRVLGLLIAEWLAERFPHEQEGALGRRLADLVAQPALAAIAAEIGIEAMLSAAPGEVRAGVKRQATVLADAMEAVIGAIYLDGGLAAARDFVRHAWAGVLDRQVQPPKDAKTTLQEWALARAPALPHYEVTARSGPPHAPVFTITVRVGEQAASGTAGSKRAAEQAAAGALLALLGAS